MMRLLDAVFLLQVVPLCKRKMKAIGAPYRKTMSIFPMGAAGGNRNRPFGRFAYREASAKGPFDALEQSGWPPRSPRTWAS